MSVYKKSFFYNPFFRLSVYISAWAFLKCFQLIGLLIPKSKLIVEKYHTGFAIAPAIIGFTSGTLFSILFIALVYKSTVWNFQKVMLLPILYILIGLAGWLSLVKLRDYEQER
jgi:uncharacterized membrane protein YuzA (DUF378 family)